MNSAVAPPCVKPPVEISPAVFTSTGSLKASSKGNRSSEYEVKGDNH